MPGNHRVNRLKLHELEVLLAVARAGSMAKAAAQLALSEPAVSRSISDLENTLGVSLIDRSSKGVEPTPCGRALIKRGVAVFDELRQGIREIETIKDPTIGEVHIGATSTIAEVGIVAAVIGQMSQKYPRINFHVVEATPERLLHELRERSLDLIILLRFDPVASNDIVSEMLYEDRMVIVAAAENPWTRQSRVELVDLVDENWTLPELEHPVTSIVASAFRAIGCGAPRVTATAAPGRIRDTLLATGRFLTVVQESALHFGATLPQFKVLPVELAIARGTTSILTLKRRALSPAARLFIEYLREAAEPLAKRNSAPSREQSPRP
jgi:DNA-binding transcriptional LysR family regulator